MQKILILNGLARKNRLTTRLTHAFIAGAKINCNQVQEIFTNDLVFKGPLWPNDQLRDNPYKLADFLNLSGKVGEFYRTVNAADIIVLASPIYWWSLLVVLNKRLIIYSLLAAWYRQFERC